MHPTLPLGPTYRSFTLTRLLRALASRTDDDALLPLTRRRTGLAMGLAMLALDRQSGSVLALYNALRVASFLGTIVPEGSGLGVEVQRAIADDNWQVTLRVLRDLDLPRVAEPLLRPLSEAREVLDVVLGRATASSLDIKVAAGFLRMGHHQMPGLKRQQAMFRRWLSEVTSSLVIASRDGRFVASAVVPADARSNKARFAEACTNLPAHDARHAAWTLLTKGRATVLASGGTRRSQEVACAS